ncbi:hypothetical protein KFL_005870040 [Klebsormidium nitens]|uniref:Uncharacterized protein n=1 Tax=Klebsormidium nitens TaxID=105231 RepID=A0A1Y1IGL8_KLENI|nr:hypothetical protein KFL_005870040 [Klebsormidium nitens]|eukprot:GAQ89995.1 hypothetical protein KFL_005870040 [Klebsormidium nitens]
MAALIPANISFLRTSGDDVLPVSFSSFSRKSGRKAADQGHHYAQFNLGVCYEYGKGVGKDVARAVECYRKAADQGNADAHSKLGLCYEHGKGVSKDGTRAMQLYRKAADQGHGAAQSNLAAMTVEGGGGLSQDWVAAAKLFELAAKNSDQLSDKLCLAWLLWTGRGVDQDIIRAQALAAQVRSRARNAKLLVQPVAIGPFWPTVLKWFYSTTWFDSMTTPGTGLSQVAPEPQPDNTVTTPNGGPLRNASEPQPNNTTTMLEAGPQKGGVLDDLALTKTERKYLSQVLGRENDLDAIEEERRDIVKDPCMRRYYLALQQTLCGMFVGAQACQSGLVKKRHDLLTQGAIEASSKIVGLLPVYGHLAEGVVKSAAQEVADYFAGKNAERIARAGGTDGALVSEGVARYLVFARKGELSSVPRDAYEKAVSKVVKADVEKMMTWIKSESDLSTIREESDVTGEQVVRRLVAAAEPSWAQTITLAAAPGPAVAAQSQLGGSAGAAGAPDSSQTVDVETFRKLVSEMDGLKEQMRKIKATMPNEGTAAFEIDAGGGQAFVQVQSQESATGGASRADTLNLQRDFAQLCVVVDELKGRIDFYEKRGFRASIVVRAKGFLSTKRGSKLRRLSARDGPGWIRLVDEVERPAPSAPVTSWAAAAAAAREETRSGRTALCTDRGSALGRSTGCRENVRRNRLDGDDGPWGQ